MAIAGDAPAIPRRMGQHGRMSCPGQQTWARRARAGVKGAGVQGSRRAGQQALSFHGARLSSAASCYSALRLSRLSTAASNLVAALRLLASAVEPIHAACACWPSLHRLPLQHPATCWPARHPATLHCAHRPPLRLSASTAFHHRPQLQHHAAASLLLSAPTVVRAAPSPGRTIMLLRVVKAYSLSTPLLSLGPGRTIMLLR
jgi:hypothetical protein